MTPVRLRRIFLAALAAVLPPAVARAALPDEIQVYTDDVEAPGEFALELHVNTTPRGRSTPDYPGEVAPHRGWRVTPEFSLGLARNWDAGLYLPTVRSAEGTQYFAGPKFRLKWLPLRPAEGSTGSFAGINGEVAFVEPRFEQARRTVELRPILGHRGEDWLFAFNPIVGADLAGAQKGVLTFAPAAKASRRAFGETALGVEYYADLGRLSHFAPRAEQSHTLYFVADTPKINFGIGRGLSGAADRWTVKAILSF
jgi:hypothetical protein